MIDSDEIQKLLSKLEIACSGAVSAIAYSQAGTYEEPVPSLNEARYACTHIIRFLQSNKDGESQREELRRAISHFERAKKDAIQYLIWRYAQWYIRLTEDSRFGRLQCWIEKDEKNRAIFIHATKAFALLSEISAKLSEDVDICGKTGDCEGTLEQKISPLRELFNNTLHMDKGEETKMKIPASGKETSVVASNQEGIDALENELVDMYKKVEGMMARIGTYEATEPLPDAVYTSMGYAGLAFSEYVIKSRQGIVEHRELVSILDKALSRAYLAYIVLSCFYIVLEFPKIRKIVKKFRQNPDFLRKEQLDDGWKFSVKEYKVAERFFLSCANPMIQNAYYRGSFSASREQVRASFASCEATLDFIGKFNELWRESGSLFNRSLREDRFVRWIKNPQVCVGFFIGLCSAFFLLKGCQGAGDKLPEHVGESKKAADIVTEK